MAHQAPSPVSPSLVTLFLLVGVVVGIDIDALVAEARALITDAEPILVPVVLAGKQAGVRLIPMQLDEWHTLTLQHPPRKDILQDLNLVYNVDAVCAAYPHVSLVMGDQVDDMIRQDDEGEKVSRWPAVWSSLTKQGRKDVFYALWQAHEDAPEKIVVDAGKASAGVRKKKRG